MWSHTSNQQSIELWTCTVADKTAKAYSMQTEAECIIYIIRCKRQTTSTANSKNYGRKIRIKDIAERAGVSVGTVDRVLHDRPNVSKPAREKVEQALKEMNYQPNMYASALAYNKSYTFYLLIPKHESEAYWEEIEEGARKCEETRRDFHIDVEILFYERSSEESFREQGQAVIDAQPEGVIVVPSSLEVTRSSPTSFIRRASHSSCSTPICPTFVLSRFSVKIPSVAVSSPPRCS